MNVADRPAPASGSRVAWWRVLSWQMYDFADTIYSMNVYTLYFGLFLAAVYHKDSADFGWALTLANLLVAIISPVLGAMSDVSQRRMPFVRFFAVLTAITTALIAFAPSYVWAVALFVLSYFFYQSAWNFYQALLPGLATEKNVSLVSGIGIALGYVGSLAGVLSVRFVIPNPDSNRAVFWFSAALYMLFALPCLLLVPDFADATHKLKLNLGAAYKRISETLTHARSFPGLFRFLIADFIYENAVQAVIAFMAIFCTKALGLSSDAATNFLMFATVFAILGGFAFGPLVDRIGPKPGVMITLAIWLLVLPLVTLVQTQTQLYILGPVAGIALAATWVASRTFLVALAPVGKSGEFFGLYSLSGKAAGVVGVAAWTVVLTLFKDRIGEPGALKSAVWVMWLFIVAGMVLVYTLPNARPSKANILDRSTKE